ncbi:MAG: cell wall-binding repeat-containing protein [Actinomycetales bacterium]
MRTLRPWTLAALTAVTAVAATAVSALPAIAVDGVLMPTGATTTSTPWRVEGGPGYSNDPIMASGGGAFGGDGYALFNGRGDGGPVRLHRSPAPVGLAFATLPAAGAMAFLNGAPLTLELTVDCSGAGSRLVLQSTPAPHDVPAADKSMWQEYNGFDDNARWTADKAIEADGSVNATATGEPGEIAAGTELPLSDYQGRCAGDVLDEAISWPGTVIDAQIDMLHFERYWNYGTDQADARDQPVERLSGTDRVVTASNAGQRVWNHQVQSAVLASSRGFADSLGGAALASKQGVPLLLTDPTSLRSEVVTALRHVVVPGGTVYVLGGESALSAGVAKQVAALGFHVTRLAGANRYETAAKIAQATSSYPGTIFLADGTNFPDGLAAGPVAGGYGNLLLTDHDVLPQATADYLKAYPESRIVAVGGPAARAAGDLVPTEDRIVGSDRYATSLAIANRYFLYTSYNNEVAVLASGENWPDALAGAPIAGWFGNPLLLTPKAGLTPELASFLKHERLTLGYGFAMGGTSALSNAVLSQAYAAITD